MFFPSYNISLAGDLKYTHPEGVSELSSQGVPARALAVDSGIVKIHYATLRKWTGSRSQPRWFGHQVNTGADPLNYGTCLVSIPKHQHKPGNVEKWDLTHFVFERDRYNTDKYVVVSHPRRKNKKEFGDDITMEVGRRKDKEVLVFVHGFNNTFDDAASRLAVLAYDMNFNGVSVLYSWPSRGGDAGVQSYARDEEQVRHAYKSFPVFLEWISSLARSAGAERVNVVAHSMGNRVLVEGLTKLAGQNKPKLVNEVVMAAPDVLRERFEEDYWREMHSVADRVTLYASNQDWPLAISKALHQNPRIGQVPPEGPFVAEGLDTVDASEADFSTFGLNHNYFGGPTVVKDLKKVLRDGLSPERRSLRRKLVIGSFTVWTF